MKLLMNYSNLLNVLALKHIILGFFLKINECIDYSEDKYNKKVKEKKKIKRIKNK